MARNLCGMCGMEYENDKSWQKTGEHNCDRCTVVKPDQTTEEEDQ